MIISSLKKTASMTFDKVEKKTVHLNNAMKKKVPMEGGLLLFKKFCRLMVKEYKLFFIQQKRSRNCEGHTK